MDSKEWIEELKRMEATDIMAIDRDSLVDIADVTFDENLTGTERVMDYIRQIKNPYCYISHDMVVKIGFSGNKKLEDCIASCISLEK